MVGKITTKDRGKKQFFKNVETLETMRLKVGVVGIKAAQKHGDTGLTNAELAAIHEFGVPEKNIPERSFIRAGIDENVADLKKVAAFGVKAVASGALSERQALGRLGLVSVAGIQKKFTDGTLEPNKPATIKAKKSSTPLIDTGQLRQSIGFEVVPSEKKL